MRKTLSIFILILAYSITVQADDSAVHKYRNLTPQQIIKLPKDKINSDVPMMYTMATQRGLSNGSNLLFGMELNQLMYPGMHDYNAAMKAFQADLGDKPTGVLTVWQIHQLEQRAEMQKLSAVGFPDQYSSTISEGYASVQGTMTIIDDKIAWPINHVRVSCIKSENSCSLNQIYLTLPDEKSWSQMYSVMEDTTETYEIVRWDENSIESHPLGTSESCRTTNLSFNFKTKEFYFITRNAGGSCKLPLGGELEKLKKPRVAQIVDGEKIINEKFSAIKQAAHNVLSSAFRKNIESLDKLKK